MMNIFAILWSLLSRLVEVLTLGWRIETFVVSASCVCWLDLLRGKIPYGEGGTLKMVEEINEYTGWTKKKCVLKKHGHNSSEIHQKRKKLVCFGKFSLNAAG